MLELSPAATTAILNALNAPERLREFKGRIRGKAIATWIANENDPTYTGTSQLRGDMIAWMDALLVDLRTAGDDASAAPVLHPWVATTDFYFYTGRRATRGALERHVRCSPLLAGELPIVCFVILDRVFSYSSSAQTWSTRPFLGAGPPRRRGRDECAADYPTDPLLQLPYSRKYDIERAQAARSRSIWRFERLMRAFDCLGIVEMRIANVPSDGLGRRFEWPELADIQAELADDHLMLRIDDFGMAYGGRVLIELVELEDTWHDGAHGLRPAYPPLFEGYYRGVLGEVIRARGYAVSVASLKKMLLAALDELTDRMLEAAHALVDEAWEAREAECDAFVAQLERYARAHARAAKKIARAVAQTAEI